LKAKARRDRWEEEHTLLQNEMTWTVLYFRTMQRIWTCRAQQAGDVNDGGNNEPLGPSSGRRCGQEEAAGLKCYAYKQASTWSKLADHASARFSAAQMKGTTRGRGK